MKKVSLDTQVISSDDEVEKTKKFQEKASKKKSKEFILLRDPDTGAYHRIRKDHISFQYDDLADEEDLQQELERIQSRLNENKKHVEARAFNDPVKKEEVRQLIYASIWNRIRKQPYFEKGW